MDTELEAEEIVVITMEGGITLPPLTGGVQDARGQLPV